MPPVRGPHAVPLLDLRPGERVTRGEGRHHLGASPSYISQGIEFDYSCVHAAMSLREHYETIMVNCNETVSTDYDIPDRLLRAPDSRGRLGFTAECAAGRQGHDRPARRPDPAGSLAADLERADADPGHQPRHRPGREDRTRKFGKRFSGRSVPGTRPRHHARQVIAVAAGGLPIVRPSFVLGRGMAIINDEPALRRYLASLELLFSRGPLLIDRFLDAAIGSTSPVRRREALHGRDHGCEAGIHSVTPHRAASPPDVSARLGTSRPPPRRSRVASALRGLINIQFALLRHLVLEGERASVPFASKANGRATRKGAALIRMGAISFARARGAAGLRTLARFDGGSIAVGAAVSRSSASARPAAEIVDTVLGPECARPVVGIDRDFPTAFANLTRRFDRHADVGHRLRFDW